MKILIDARLYGLENAGLGRYLIGLIDELAKIDHSNEYGLLLRQKYYKNLSLLGNWKKILADFRHYSFGEQVKLPSLISSFDPDLVHFPHFNVPVFYSGRFVVTIHDLLMHKSSGREATTLNPLVYNLKRVGYKKVFAHAVINSSGIIVPTQAVYHELSHQYSFDIDKIKVIYEGFYEMKPPASESLILKKHKIKEPYFIYVGNLYPHKNTKRLVEALYFLNKKANQKIGLVIVCSRSVFSERLESMVRELGAGSFVSYLGFVEDQELAALYKNSLAFVYPSLLEGFGLPGLEAMSAGTLVAASDIPVFKEVYGRNVLYFNPHDFSSIERCLSNIVAMSAQKRKGLIENAKKHVKRYTWEKMARETLDFYESCNSLR